MSASESIEEYIESLRPLPIAHLQWMAEHIDRERFPDRYKAIIDEISEKKLHPPRVEEQPSEHKILQTMDILSKVYLVLAVLVALKFLWGMIHGKEVALWGMAISLLMNAAMYIGFRYRKLWVIPLLFLFIASFGVELLVEKDVLKSAGTVIGKALRGLFYCYQLSFLTRKRTLEILGVRRDLFQLKSLYSLRKVTFPEATWPLQDVILGAAIVMALWVLPHVYVPKLAPWRWYLLGFAFLMAGDVILLVYSFCVFWRRGIWPPFKVSARSNLLKNSFKWILVGLAVQVAVGVIGGLITTIFNIQPEQDVLFRWATSAPINLWIVFTVVLSFTLGPVAEEVFFRGFIYGWLRVRIPLLFAIGIQAVFFSVMHGTGLLTSVLIFLAGIALAVIYEKRRELMTPVIVHSAMNAMVAVPVFVLMIQNYHYVARDWNEAATIPSWFEMVPSKEIERQSDGMEQWQYAIDKWGSKGSRQWKKEANAFQAVCVWFPKDRKTCAKAKLGIITIYADYLGDYRRGIVEADKLFLDYHDQKEQCASTLLKMGRAYLMLKDFKKSRESFKRVLSEFSEFKEAAESARERIKQLDAFEKEG